MNIYKIVKKTFLPAVCAVMCLLRKLMGGTDFTSSAKNARLKQVGTSFSTKLLRNGTERMVVVRPQED